MAHDYVNKKTQALEYHVTAKNTIYGPTMPNWKFHLHFHVKHAKLSDFFGIIAGRYDKELVNLIYSFVWLKKVCYDKPMKSTPLQISIEPKLKLFACVIYIVWPAKVLFNEKIDDFWQKVLTSAIFSFSHFDKVKEAAYKSEHLCQKS